MQRLTRQSLNRSFRLGMVAASALALVAAPCGAQIAPPPISKTPAAVLFWSQPEKEAGFQDMESRFPTHTVKHGDKVLALPDGKPLTLTIARKTGTLSLDQYMAAEKTAGLLVVQDGRVRLERYALGYGSNRRWTSFSVAKSFTSTLVGAAIRDGYIKSLDEPITTYITGLKGSAYEGVTVRQLLTMTSGVKWNEDYTDPKSDVAALFSVLPDPGVDPTVSYMRKLPREAAPGTKWVYKTGETNLIGVLVTAATHKTLADYLSEKIWRPFGMETDAAWMVDERGQEAGGCCISVSLRDYARMGLFVLGGGVVEGKSVVPDGWFQAAVHKQADIGEPGRGYGYQWWTNDDGTWDAIGIFGQRIHFDPARKLIVVVSSAWPEADPPVRYLAVDDLLKSVAAAVDAHPQ